jgi:phospholipid N-methyltransferase
MLCAKLITFDVLICCVRLVELLYVDPMLLLSTRNITLNISHVLYAIQYSDHKTVITNMKARCIAIFIIARNLP